MTHHLPYETDALENVPEPYRALYAPNDNGGHILQIDGAPGLTSALQKERTARREAERQFKALGKTPEELAAAVELAGSFERTLQQHREKSAQDVATIAAERDAALAGERATIADTVLRVALEKAKATDEGLDLLPERLIGRIKVATVDGKRTVKIMAADGVTPMLRADGKPAGFDDLVRSAATEFPSLFAATGAGGAGTTQKSLRPSSPKVLTRREWDALGPQTRADKMRDGWKVVD